MSPKRNPKTGWQPKYSKHASGQGYVRIDGKMHYLGRHGTKESLAAYDKLIAEWRANQFRPTAEMLGETLVCELCAMFMDHARVEYRKYDKPTGEFYLFKNLSILLDEMYGTERANEFTPVKLRAVRERLLEPMANGQTSVRQVINGKVDRIRWMWRWGVEHGYVDNQVYLALKTVRGLKKGKTDAPEKGKVKPAVWADVERTLPFLPHPVADLVRVHRFLGCRANEITFMRVCDLHEIAGHWRYTPPAYKQDHHADIDVYYWVGPQAMEIISKHLEGKKGEDLVFPWTVPRGPYYGMVGMLSRDAYNSLVVRACRKAGVVPAWHPREIRHLRATEIREAENQSGRYGAEAAQAVLRHQQISTTEIYAEKDKIAIRIQGEMG